MRKSRLYRGQAFIDKISVTVPVPEEYWETSTDNMMEASYSSPCFKPVIGGIERNSYQIYRFAWRLTLPLSPQADTFIYVQALPSDPRTGFLRLEWNPVRNPKDALKVISEFFEQWIPNFSTFLRCAMITRIDITTDIRHTKITDLYIFTNSAKTQYVEYKQNHGSLNGCELGVPKSPRRLIVYDKRFERTCKGKAETSPFASSLTRIEFRLLRLGRLDQIERFTNQLAGFSVALSRSAKRARKGRGWSAFIANCERYGAQVALSRYLPGTRAEYRRILNSECKPEWYDPAEIWREGMRDLRHLVQFQSH